MLTKLNEQQRDAATTVDVPVRIIAGPGTGKTRTITAKVTHLINTLEVEPYKILVITFTNKAANELKERIKNTILDSDLPEVFTYHAWAARFLRVEAKNIGLKNDYRIIDTDDVISMVKGLATDDETIDSKEILSYFNIYAHNYQKFVNDINNENHYEYFYAKIYKKYIDKKKELNVLDFDDLLFFTSKVLNENNEIRNKYKKKYDYILIDEFQDTNELQYKIIKSITESDSKITVVGDPDQNIYSWRGSKVDLILNFDKDFPKTKTVILKNNYRSTKNILDAANKLISFNKQRIQFDLFPTKNEGQEVKLVEAYNSKHESNVVISTISKLVSEKNVNLKDIAIIFRSAYVSRDFELSLIENRINYKLIGGIKFFERREVKDVMNFLHFCLFKDDYSLLQILNLPPKGFGNKSVTKLTDDARLNSKTIWNYLIENKLKFPKLIEFIKVFEKINVDSNDFISQLEDTLKQIGFYEYYSSDENKTKNIANIIQEISYSIEKSEKNINEWAIDFFNSSALSSSSDTSNSDNTLSLITIHAAKGLEFKYVFFVSVNQGVIPSNKAIISGDIEEERRAAYVAITRAIDELYITYSEGPSFGGQYKEKSQFVEEIFNDNKEYNYMEQNLTNGSKIIHAIFGEGVIISESNETITVAFNKRYGIKELDKNHPSIKLK